MNKEIKQVLREIHRARGFTECRACSSRDWEVWHEPGKCRDTSAPRYAEPKKPVLKRDDEERGMMQKLRELFCRKFFLRHQCFRRNSVDYCLICGTRCVVDGHGRVMEYPNEWGTK